MKLESVKKKILVEVYLDSLKRGKFGRNLDKVSKFRKLGESLCLTPLELRNHLASMQDERLLLSGGKSPFELASDGRKMITVVMAGGSFDIIHPGHIETLSLAKELGDALVVSVARDSTFLKNKKRQPMHNEEQRCELVASVRCVDAAVLGSETNIYDTVRFLKPDIIALGYDQMHSDPDVERGARQEGIEVKVVRLSATRPEIKTSRIVSRQEALD